MRPINLFGSFPSGGLGQSRPLTGLSLGWNEASQWLADAEKVVAANPACDLPIVSTFRMFVNGTASTDRLGARLDLNPDDMRSLADFKQCQISKPAAVAAIQAAADAEAAKRKEQIAGLAGAAIALGVLGYFITKAS